MKLNLDINQQNALFAAYSQLDSYEDVTKGVIEGAKIVRVPYKLGINRRIVVKNMNALRASLANYEEAHKSLFKEIFPTKDQDDVITMKDDPEGCTKFRVTERKMKEAKDELDLQPLPAAVLYPDDPNAREFPAPALLTLEQHGLIEEAAAAPKVSAAA